MFQIGVDIGGTFTDFIVKSEKKTTSLKLPSDPKNPERVVLKGLENLAEKFDTTLEDFLSKTTRFVHGNTVAINALLQKKLPKTCLITTAGFRDAIEIRRSQLKNQWDFFIEVPEVLVPRNLRFGLNERIDAQGREVKKLDFENLEEICIKIKEENVEAVAVCLLFSFLDPTHEKQVKEYLQERLPDVFISLSSEVAPKIGEYERTSTTILNASLSPLVAEYLLNLRNLLKEKGLKCHLQLVQNNGGLADVTLAKVSGVKGLLSGPAAGAYGGQALAKLIEYPNLIVADMGGTSFDVSLVKDYSATVIPESEINEYPINLPMIEIQSIGVGGGSIASVDKSGLLNVGPESAGANPGPACYNRGGEEPTITDAALVLGLLNPDNFSEGLIKIKPELSYKAIEEKVARPLNLSVKEAALAIYKVAASKMVDSIRLMTVQKGFDPRDFYLVACGGAAPLFASEIVKGLGIKKIIIPNYSPVFCARGMLDAPVKVDLVQSSLKTLQIENVEAIKNTLEEILEKGKKELQRQGVPEEKHLFKVFYEVKYTDQHHQISVPCDHKEVTGATIDYLIQEFNRLHEFFYGYNQIEKECLLVSIRLEAFEKLSPSSWKEDFSETKEKLTTPLKEREIINHKNKTTQKIPVYDFKNLSLEKNYKGPAIIEKEYTTIFVDEKMSFKIDPSKNIILF